MSASRVVFMNGRFVPEHEARISIYDSALMFGDMVFEMTRSFGRRHFKLDAHLERLYASMRHLRIPEPMALPELRAASLETAEANEASFARTDEHRLMINVSRGPLAIYADVFGGDTRPTVVIADFPLKWTVASMAPLFDRGVNAIVPSQRAIPAHLLDPKVKNRSRIHYMMANIEVSQCAGEDNWALLLDPDGFVAEGTGSNFFMVKDGVLITPEPRNILRGISRAYVMELAADLGHPCVERNIDLYDVTMADEAFMTATPFCMVPVTRINGSPIGNGRRGAMTQALLSRWSTNVGVDIEEQIRAYAAEVVRLRADGPTPYQFRAAR